MIINSKQLKDSAILYSSAQLGQILMSMVTGQVLIQKILLRKFYSLFYEPLLRIDLSKRLFNFRTFKV